MIAKKVAQKIIAQHQMGEGANKFRQEVYRLRPGQGVSVSDGQSNHGIAVEKIPGMDEWWWKVFEFPNGDTTTIEDEEELERWLQENLDGNIWHSPQVDVYRIADNEGRPLKMIHDPDIDDQGIGEYEQYGPDPIRMTDLQ